MERTLAFADREKEEAISLAMVVQETVNENKYTIIELQKQVLAQQNTIEQLEHNLKTEQERVRDLKTILCRSNLSSKH